MSLQCVENRDPLLGHQMSLERMHVLPSDQRGEMAHRAEAERFASEMPRVILKRILARWIRLSGQHAKKQHARCGARRACVRGAEVRHMMAECREVADLRLHAAVVFRLDVWNEYALHRLHAWDAGSSLRIARDAICELRRSEDFRCNEVWHGGGVNPFPVRAVQQERHLCAGRVERLWRIPVGNLHLGFLRMTNQQFEIDQV